MSIARTVIFCGAALLLFVRVANSQVVPPAVDAGQVPGHFKTPTSPKALPGGDTIQLPSTVPPAEAGRMMLSVSRFEIAGSTIYSQAEFAALTEPLLHKAIPLAGVYELAARITALYGKDGYVLSRAIVPPQAFSARGAVVRIEILEGYVDEVVWPEGLKEKYRDFFSDYAARITEERPVNIKTIERYLLLASDLPGLRFSSTFKAAKTHKGASTLFVTVTEKHLSGEASIDNRGSEGRGPWEAQVSATASNLLGRHEEASIKYATAVHSMNQLQFVEGSWKQVLNPEGLTYVFTGSYNTGVPGLPPLEAINYASTGTVFTSMLAYPIIRSRDENLTISGTLFAEDVKSTALSTPFTDDRLRGGRFGLVYDNADTFGGTDLVQLTLSHGIDGLGSTSTDNLLASRAGGHVDFTKVELLATRTQSLARAVPGLSLYGAIFGQYTQDPLLVVEQCSYGGKTFGRAFDPSTLTGDNCVTSLAELRYDISVPESAGVGAQLYSFIDHGYVDRNTVSLGTPKEQWASSAGAGLRLNWADHATLGVEGAKEIAGDVELGWRTHAEFTVHY